jgi:hypothetical protein
MDDAVFFKQTMHEIPVIVTLAAGPPKDGDIPVSIGLNVDVKGLQFAVLNGRHMQQIAILTTLLDANGGFVTGKESILELALTDEKLASLKRDGLKTVATFNAPPGIYQVRTVVREGMKGSSRRRQPRSTCGRSKARRASEPTRLISNSTARYASATAASRSPIARCATRRIRARIL